MAELVELVRKSGYHFLAFFISGNIVGLVAIAFLFWIASIGFDVKSFLIGTTFIMMLWITTHYIIYRKMFYGEVWR
jgi:4-hydroxybenzoate polyprenyltransferase